MSKKEKLKIAGIILVILVSVGVAIKLIPHVMAFATQAGRDEFKETLTSFGTWGWVLFLGIQVLQVIIAVIPGEPVEILAGFLYGTWGGLFTCLLGLLVGTMIVYYMVKLLGQSFINKLAPPEKMEKYQFLKNTKRLEVIVFILFFIPGTPKDILTYFVPLTPLKPITFFIISLVARIPSVVSSTFAGTAIESGDWITTVAVFAVTGVLGLVGILLHDKITKRFGKSEEK